MRHTIPPATFALLLAAVLAMTPIFAFSQSNEFDTYIPLIFGKAPQLAVSNNLAVTSATYLGGTGSDTVAALDIAPDGGIVVGGVFPGYTPLNVTPIIIQGAGDGAILRLDGEGKAVRSITRIGNKVNDLEVAANGVIVACGDFGVAQLDPDATTVSWSAKPGEGSRCSVGGDGTVAVAAAGSMYVYNAQGSPLGDWRVSGTLYDVAVDGTGQTVIASGYTQKDVSGFCMGQLQVAFIRGWSYDGRATWNSYDWSAQQAGGANVCADTRGERVTIGEDGLLYLAATINGGTGASIFARDPQDITRALGKDQNISTDQYNTASNVGSVKMTWFGRYNPSNGALIRGTSLMTRLSSGQGNSIVARSIDADAQGHVFLAGDTACCIQNRDQRQIAGTTVGAYASGEAFFLAVSPDLTTRFIWTTFPAPGGSAGGSPATAVAAGKDRVAIGANANNGRLITFNALQAELATQPDAYVAIWPTK